MLVLNTDSIKDFQICERLYGYRHLENFPEKIYSRDIYTNRFEVTIKSILHYFWYKKQAGSTPSYSSIINRWEKLWFPKNTDAYDIINDQHESLYGNVASLTTKAASLLLRFYEVYSDTDIVPIAISDDYIAKISNDIRIEDKFDLIFYLSGKTYVVKFIFNYKNSNSYMYQVDFSSMYAGFKTRHPDRLPSAKFGYIDLMSDNIKFSEYMVSDEDREALEYWCDTIYNKEVLVPRRNLNPYCKKCPFDEPCSKWNGWK